jgi:hypothetical protein
VSSSAQARTAAPAAQPQAQSPERAQRPLIMAGAIAAGAAAASGLAVLTTIAAIGWITAPHVGLGSGLPGVLRTAGVLWLVGHHVGVTARGFGHIGLLPLGLVPLPGFLLVKAGRWLVQAAAVRDLRRAGFAIFALAGPYATITGAVALASDSQRVEPSLWQAVLAGLLIGAVAGGIGITRELSKAGRPGELAKMVTARPRSVIAGVLAATAVLVACGALLAGGSLAAHLQAYRAATDELNPGLGGSVLLLLAGIAYAPNAIVWSIAYMLGPGFAFGAGTMVAPTGSALGPLPAFPMLAALPAGIRGGAPAPLAVAVLAAPYLAGALGGLVMVRVAPAIVLEAAPLWGFVTGSITGLLTGVVAAFSGGPLGDGHLADVGPNGLQTALVAVLEIGVTSAVVAGAANWMVFRKRKAAVDVPLGVVYEQRHDITDETDDAGGHRIYIDPWAEDNEE